MNKAPFTQDERSQRARSSRRRPTGVSRRQRKKQLGFETLEDRRVMSAQSPLATLQGAVSDDVQLNVQSFSSGSSDGQVQILLNELYWQSLIAATGEIEAELQSIPTDPLLAQQWHLINTAQEVGNPDFQDIFAVAGEDINVASVWNLGFTGEGVVVAVIDSGVETTHPDLAANISPTLQLDPLDGDTNPNPLLFDPINAHGTAVAGLIGAVADNGIGGTGVAPGATLAPIRLIDVGQTEQAFIDAFRFANQDIDITNNSWNPVVVRGISGPTAAQFLALRDSILFGRKADPTDQDGLGVIHVFSAGNDAGTPFDFGFQSIGGWDSSTYDGWVSSRYTIGVTGVDHDGFYNNVDGTVTGYPEVSAGILVAAPTGSNAALNIVDDTGIGSGIFTTDTTGETGFNFAPDPVTNQEFDRDFLTDTDYTSRFNGTSAAAPLVSGVIALMLEANPNLSYRDVQEILVRSARQNAEFDIPNASGVGSTQNTWIQNQMPVFHDPDLWDPTISPFVQTFTPTLDPSLTDAGFNPGPSPAGPNTAGQALNSVGNTGAHYQPTPQTLTNGAGFTISQGKGVHGELIGYAHGVIDAELAVQLALQWNTKNQALPSELTYTSFISPSGGLFINVPAAEVGNADSGFQLVPGGLGGGAGFIGFWNEYFADDPFNNNPLFAPRGGYLELSVPENNTMTIENIEVKLSLLDNADDVEFLNNMRVLLVSPTGTHHELNHFFVDPPGNFSHQNSSPYTFFNSPELTSVDTDPTNPGVVTFTSNRSWGERSDNAIIFDPTTAEPAATSGNGLHGWQLHFENYSLTNDVGITGIEVAWHGSRIVETGTQRLQGLVGVDDNRDDLFDFDRVTITNVDVDGVVRFGEVFSTINLDHESMGANVTVFAHRDDNGNGILDASDTLVDQFVTGADGNYYFDLVPDTYIISVEDAAGRTAVDDTLTPSGFLKNFQSQWVVTPDFFQVWDYDTALDVPLDPVTNAPFPFFGAGAASYHVNHINFLLDPGPAVPQQVDFSGAVFADLNGDGIFNGDDVAVPGVGVFGDIDRNGTLDPGEILTTTDANGQYTLTVPALAANVINVGVRPPANWSITGPVEGFSAFFVEPGLTFSDVDFFVQPPSANSSGDGSLDSGIVLGVVFNDSNQDAIRQTGEVGVPNQTVYVDMNNSGAIDAGDVVTQTNSNGAYAFADLPDGNHIIRVAIAPDSVLSQTFPILDLPQVAAVISGGTVVNANFGLSSGASGGVLDFGDLPDIYGTRLVDDGARHPEGIFYLGSMIDAEADGQPAADALGDDTEFIPDEDGVTLAGGLLVPNSTGTVTVTASRHSGFLQAWMDFDNSGSFEASEQVIVNELLDAGANPVTFDIPAIVGSTVYARFRFGEYGLGSTGLAVIGEVEDYAFSVAVPGPGSEPTISNGADFDADGDIDGSDFLALQRGFSMANPLPSEGDANDDGVVDADDLTIFMNDYGDGSAAVAAATSGDGGDAFGGSLSSSQFDLGTPIGARVGEAAVSLDAYFGGYSYGQGSLYQPGFPEDLPAAVLDTSDSDTLFGSERLASLASAVELFATPDRIGPATVSMIENTVEDFVDERNTESGTELGLTSRDHAMDQFTATQIEALEDSDSEYSEQRRPEDALAVALAEDVVWRLL